MYKRIDLPNNQIEIQEHFKSPMVYLDHWALNDLSLDDNLRKKFVKVMNEKGGTFRLSVINILELSKQGDKSQVDNILEMISSIHDCGLINIDPREVIHKENSLIEDPAAIYIVKNPSAEIEIIATYIMAHNYPEQWHVSDIIRAILPELPSKHMIKRNLDFLNDMQRLLNTGRGDDKYLKKASKRFKTLKDQGPRYQAATREILQMAIDFVLRNINMKMNKYSEWEDVFHVIVPVAYCDVVLIDRRWSSFINQTGFKYPRIAQIFDKRTLDDFFNTIENWENHSDSLRPNLPV